MIHMFSDLPAFRRDPLGFFLKTGNTATQPLVRMRLGPWPTYMVTDPALVKPVLGATEEAIDKGRLIYKMREVIGLSSITLSGEPHRERRAVIHRQFQAGLAGPYVTEIASTIRHTATSFVKDDTSPTYRITAQLALRVICTILFGHGSLSPGDENAIIEAVHLVEDDLAEGMFRILPHSPWAYRRKKRKLKEARQIMSLVVDRMQSRADQHSLMGAFQKIGLQGEALRDEVLLMLLAGHHTSGTAMAWLLYHLALEPELRAKIANEAVSLTTQFGEIDHSAVKHASQSRAFVQEILRLYPSTYWLSRETKQPQIIGPVSLKKGTSLLISPWHLHRDPRLWNNPEEFDVTRSYAGKAFLPFGAGPRACVGTALAMVELQLVALEFAAAFDMAVATAVPAAPPHPSVTLVPSDFRVTFSPRSARNKATQQAA